MFANGGKLLAAINVPSLPSSWQSTGEPDRIQVSEATADLLKRDGKGSWLKQRDDPVHAKGKGMLTTFWVRCDDDDILAESAPIIRSQLPADNQKKRNIDWAVTILLQLIRQVVARRSTDGRSTSDFPSEFESASYEQDLVNELQDVIELPSFKAPDENHQQDPDEIVNETVKGQLRTFVEGIADMYHSNPFHSFEHACHVTMSVGKLMTRIIGHAPNSDTAGEPVKDSSVVEDLTYGIASDPLVRLACAFAALIHDVDHRGVPNTQLAKEQPVLAAKYKHSLAEQNSLVKSFHLFMEPSFKELRTTLCATKEEWHKFRALVTNAVLATDIVDPKLKQMRNLRWEQAFGDDVVDGDAMVMRKYRRATVVMEHLIQASDVSHTMQHWQIYRKWNERFFQECHAAYAAGRAENDPSTTWYEGEIGFFDFYIIPLAKKLKECGVFGISSDEYLDYALQNRKEWEAKGRTIVKEMTRNARRRSSVQ